MKEIPLSRGEVAIVDDEDYERLKGFRWRVHKSKGMAYAHTGFGETFCPMHRMILGLARGVEADHVDGNGLNNCRANLRRATRSQNCCNRKGFGMYYKGVCKVSNWHKYSARIQVNKKMTWIGSFDTEEEAARAYDAAALKLHGEFARLNFPAEHAR